MVLLTELSACAAIKHEQAPRQMRCNITRHRLLENALMHCSVDLTSGSGRNIASMEPTFGTASTRECIAVTITYVVTVLASTSSCRFHDGRKEQFPGSHWKNALKFRTKVIIPNITASCTPHKLRVSPTSAPVKACHRAILLLENQVDDSSQPRLSKCGCQILTTDGDMAVTDRYCCLQHDVRANLPAHAHSHHTIIVAIVLLGKVR